MKVEIKNLKIDGDDLTGVFEFVASVRKIGNERYGSGDISERVSRAVAEKVSNQIIADRIDDIVKEIDMDTIYKRIQLNVVNNIINPLDRRWLKQQPSGHYTHYY